MKYLSSLLTMLCLLLVGGGTVGCTDSNDDPEPVPAPKPATVELTLGQVDINQAQLSLTTTNVVEYAWICTPASGTEAAEPTAQAIYGNASATKVTAEDGTHTITVTGLDSETAYKFYLAYSSESGIEETVYSKDFTTLENTAEVTIQLEANGAAGITDAAYTLTTQNVKEYAWMVTTDLEAAAPAPAILFNTGTRVNAQNGDNAISITGLDGNTDYRLYVAYGTDEGFAAEVLQADFKTQPFTDLVTFIQFDWYSIKFHIECPAGKTIAYTFVDRDQYNGMINFGTIAPSYFQQAKEFVYTVTESQTVTFEGWVGSDWDTGETYIQPPVPGQSLVFICAEVVDGEVDYNGRETWEPLFDWDTYYADAYGGGGDDWGPLAKPLSNEIVIDNSLDKYWLTDYYMMGYTNTKSPDHTDATVKVEILEARPKMVTFKMTPDPEIIAYGYMYMDVATYESYITFLGNEEGLISWLTTNALAMSAGEAVVSTDADLQEGFTYYLLVVAKANEEGTLSNVQKIEFQPGTATAPLCKMLVTPIPAPEGEVESPYSVWYNIRCEAGDATDAAYVFNDKGEFIKQFNDGVTYESLLESGYFFDSAMVAAINSPEGYNVCFDGLLDDSEYRLAVTGYNADLFASIPNPEVEGEGWADTRTSVLPPKTPVSSTLFDDLAGDWTLNIYTYSGSTISTTPLTSKVTIGNNTTYGELTEDIIALYGNRETAEMYYGQFKESATKYDTKFRNQNYLVCDGMHTSRYNTEFKSAWDLFCDPTYSAFDTDELFYAYGPKWYIEVNEGDVLTIPTDFIHRAPFIGHGYSTLYLTGVNTNASAYTEEPFELSLSDDKQTLTLQPKVIDGDTYNLCTVMFYSGGYMFVNARIGEMTLTKGYSEAATTAKSGRSNGAAGVQTSINVNMPAHLPQTHLVGKKPAQRVQMKQTLPADYSNRK